MHPVLLRSGKAGASHGGPSARLAGFTLNEDGFFEGLWEEVFSRPRGARSVVTAGWGNTVTKCTTSVHGLQRGDARRGPPRGPSGRLPCAVLREE